MQNRSAIPTWLKIALVVVPLLSVPWFFATGSIDPIIFGMPLWAFSTVALSTLFAALVSLTFLFYWPEDES